MPLLSLCKYPGCFAPVLRGSRYCSKHKALGEKHDALVEKKREERRTHRAGSASERGYTSRWRTVSKKFLEAHPLCAECERQGRLTVATCVDHIKPHKGDKALFWDQANWQPLCQSCHSRKTAAEDGGFGNTFKG